MSRADRRIAVAVALALGGCMRIYPDPELPDVLVEWFAEIDCADDTDRVVVSLFELDPAALAGTAAVPCPDQGVSFVDVARLRYRLAAQLEDAGGEMLASFETEIDLRDGLSERVSTFFGRPFDLNFHVGLAFDMDATCAALSATSVLVRASPPGGQPQFGFELPCGQTDFVDQIPAVPATYTLSAWAFSDTAVVATSPESAPMAVMRGSITNFGTLVMSPCGAACPLLPSEQATASRRGAAATR